MKKEKVILALDQLPQEFSTEELMDKLIFIERVEKGLADARAGRVVTFEEAKQRVRKWSK